MGRRGAVAGRGVQGRDAAVGQGEDGLAQGALPWVTFVLVVGLVDGVGAQGGEGRGEHGALEPLVAAAGDAPHHGSMSPIFWLLVPVRRRTPAGLW